MKLLTSTLKSWLPLAATITLLCGVMYALVQQTYRSNANDPQQQMAEDVCYELQNGADAQELPPSPAIEISRELSPWLMIFDEKEISLGSGAILDGKIPSLPKGVFDYTRTHDKDVISWQPRAGVRQALVILHTQGTFNGFVVAGRSLRMVEERESMLIKQVAFGWIVSLGLLLIVMVLVQAIFKPS